MNRMVITSSEMKWLVIVYPRSLVYSEQGSRGRHRDRYHDQVIVHQEFILVGQLLPVVGEHGGQGSAHEEDIGDGHAVLGAEPEAEHETDIEDGPAPNSGRLKHKLTGIPERCQ